VLKTVLASSTLVTSAVRPQIDTFSGRADKDTTMFSRRSCYSRKRKLGQNICRCWTYLTTYVSDGTNSHRDCWTRTDQCWRKQSL